MNEFDDLEKELKALQPKPPTAAFTARVEDALGDSGSVSFRRISDKSPKVSKSKLLFLLPPVLALAASLVWMLSFLPESKQGVEPKPVSELVSNPVSELVDDPDSPIHGVTLEQLETFSGMPADGWSDPGS